MIRVPTIEDAEAIARIRVDGWRTAYKGLLPDSHLDTLNYNIETDKVERIISGENSEFTSDILVYEEAGKVLAFAYYGKSIDVNYSEYAGEVVALYVMPSEKGKGIGSKLMNEMKSQLKAKGYNNMIIWCLKNNYPSIKFYEHLGGVIKHERDFIIDGLKVFEVGIVYEI